MEPTKSSNNNNNNTLSFCVILSDINECEDDGHNNCKNKYTFSPL